MIRHLKFLAICSQEFFLPHLLFAQWCNRHGFHSRFLRWSLYICPNIYVSVSMRKIEHLGLAVENIEAAIKSFEVLLNTPCYKIEEVESEYVKTAFFQVGESKIELLEATHPDSAIAKYIAKNGRGGIHHIAFDVEDIESEIQRLTAAGFELIHQSPKDGADNKRIAFLHPKSTHGMLIEMCQEKD